MAEVSTSPVPDAQLFRDAFNASPIGIAVENLDGQPIFVNPAFCKFLGFTEKELCSKHCVDFSPREDAEKDWALFQQLKAGSIDHYQMEKRYFRRDGSLVWGSLSISLLKGRSSPLVLAMVEDITEKKAAEEARYRLAAVVQSSDDAIVTRNLEGMILSWNAAAQKIYGYTEAEAIGKQITMLVPPELSDEENKIREELSAGGRVEHFETIRVTKTGNRINVSLSISPIKDSSGKMVGISGIGRDITERKQAEEALRESEERLRLAVQAGRMFAYSWDAATDRIERSGEAESILGIESDKVATGAAVSAMIHPADRDRVQTILAKLTVENPTIQVAYRMIRHDGQVVWLGRHSRAYFDQRGKLKRIVGMVVDLTERKKAEEALRASEERLRLAAKIGKMYAYDWDVATDEVVRSPEAARVLGISKEIHLTRQQLSEIVHPEDRARWLENLAELTPSTPETRLTYRVRRADGSEVWLEKNARAFFDTTGKMLRMIGMVADVTERKQAEEAVRASAERLRVAQQVARIGTFERDLQTGIVTWTREMESIYGLPAGSFGGTKAAFVKLVHPDDRPRVMKLVEGALEGAAPTQGEWRTIWPDGSVHWIAAQWQVLRDDTGVPCRVIGVGMDVTDRKRAEEALADMSRKLLQAQEQERARIGRELHDDINQRLALISIKLSELHLNPSGVQSRIKEIQRELDETSSDLEALSHDLHSSRLEYLGAIAAIKSWCKESAARYSIDIDFRTELSGRLPFVVGLPLFRIVQEAVHNAVKHSGVKRIEIEIQQDGDKIHLMVRDSGKGFDVKSALRSKGLGLTSMKERVRLINGTISIESKPMHGTTIDVRVPLSSEEDFQRAAG